MGLQKNSSSDHDAAVTLLAQKYNGRIVQIRGNANISGNRYADIELEDGSCIEVEMGVKKHKFENNKKGFWKDRRVKLCLILPKDIEDTLQEITYLTSDGREIIIK